jgi:hypothetical protein
VAVRMNAPLSESLRIKQSIAKQPPWGEIDVGIHRGRQCKYYYGCLSGVAVIRGPHHPRDDGDREARPGCREFQRVMGHDGRVARKTTPRLCCVIRAQQAIGV